ncbi:Hypothetical protein CE557_154 [Cardinium endosymbiont of Sogatella furcifera]|uniref:hypothetical protein n=1 Tax=Cardinium endosymbiont of Sogatella furcifera TaxID=650378 RepID=UPI000E10C0DB|nr:hypothetical protein [Cardinium endosymbiont of Sogatella furcifera]AXI23992.1 Hypothetical protein CE557_154 [Cardinium endosymbiont of Sogatella furcifera]
MLPLACTSLEGLVLKKQIAKKHVWMDFNVVKFVTNYQSFTEEKFLFNIEEFNRSMRYINMPDRSDRLAELCAKELLTKTKEVDVSWVNKDLFNTGVFEPKHMACMEEDSPIKLKPTQDPESEKEISQ